MYPRITNCIENLLTYKYQQPFWTRTLRYETAKTWTNLPATVQGGLCYYFDYLENLDEKYLFENQLNVIFEKELNGFHQSFKNRIRNEVELLLHNEINSSIKNIKVTVTENLLNSFFLQIEFLVRNSFIEYFLHNKARSGKLANFGQVTLNRFDSEIEVQIEKKLVIFISKTIDELINQDLKSITLRNTSSVIEYNTLIQQYLGLQTAKTLNVLSNRLYTKLIASYSKSSVEVIWPPKPLKRKEMNDDQEIDPKEDIISISKDDESKRPTPEPIEIVSYFYPSKPNLPLTIVTQIDKLDSLLFFFKKHSQFKFNSLLDALACDYPEAERRFSVRYCLLSYFGNVRLNIITLNKERLWQKSLTSLFKSANWLEREIWDLFGIYFDKHPDLRRILTDYGFMGHPLRKDFPVHGFVDIRYCEIAKSLLYTPTKLMAGWKSQDSLFNKALW